MMNSKIRRLGVYFLTALAGLLYCSWPLGYWLNAAASRRGLASELAAAGQPYYWLFIATDVASGLLVLAVSIYLLLVFKAKNSRYLKIVLANYAVFGLGTAAGALLPMRCLPSLQKCPDFTTDYQLLLHGVLSVSASICLFISVLAVWYYNRHRRSAHLMAAVLTAWILFGVFSVVFFFVPGPGYLSQHYYITICSVWVALMPHVIWPQLLAAKTGQKVVEGSG